MIVSLLQLHRNRISHKIATVIDKGNKNVVLQYERV